MRAGRRSMRSPPNGNRLWPLPDCVCLRKLNLLQVMQMPSVATNSLTAVARCCCCCWGCRWCSCCFRCCYWWRYQSKTATLTLCRVLMTFALIATRTSNCHFHWLRVISSPVHAVVLATVLLLLRLSIYLICMQFSIFM